MEVRRLRPFFAPDLPPPPKKRRVPRRNMLSYTFMYASRKVCRPLLVHLSVIVTILPYPLNRAFGIISGSGVRVWLLSRLFGTLWDRYLLIPSITRTGDSRCYVSLSLNTLLHTRPILSQYHTDLNGRARETHHKAKAGLVNTAQHCGVCCDGASSGLAQE